MNFFKMIILRLRKVFIKILSRGNFFDNSQILSRACTITASENSVTVADKCNPRELYLVFD